MSMASADIGGRADFKPRCLDISLSLSYFQLSLSYFQPRCIYHSIISEDDGDIECLWLMLIPVVLTRDYCQRKTEGPHAQITRQIPSSLSSSLGKYYGSLIHKGSLPPPQPHNPLPEGTFDHSWLRNQKCHWNKYYCCQGEKYTWQNTGLDL